MTGHPPIAASRPPGRPPACARRLPWLALLAFAALGTAATAAGRLPDGRLRSVAGAPAILTLTDEPGDDAVTTSALGHRRHVRVPARIRARLARRRALRAIARREREIAIWRREFGEYGLRRQIATERDL